MLAVSAVPSRSCRPCLCPVPEAPVQTDIKEGEELGAYDVICGRDKEAFNNIGNRRFRVTVSLTLGRYQQAQSRKEKSTVIKSVAILVQNNGGRFLQKKKGKWFQLNEKQTHEKVGHALRDMAMATAKMAETKTEPEPPAPIPSAVVAAPKRHSSTAQVERKIKRAKLLNGATPFQEVPTASRSDFDEVPPQDGCIVNSLPVDLPRAAGDEVNFSDADTILSWLMDESDQVMFEL